MKYLLVLFLIAASIANQPVPNCTNGYFWQTLPLTPNQKARYNLQDLFKGYNLEYSLESADQYDFVKLQQKFKINQQQQLITPLKGLKSFHLEEVANSWGEGFIALTQVGDLTQIHYGLLSDNKSAPVINYDVTISTTNYLNCFDTLMFAEKDLIIVDCIATLNNTMKNTFVYVQLSTGTVKNYTIDTEMYVPFKTITRRRLLFYTDHDTGYHYLLRTYFADGVDVQNSKNTYVDVFILSDPTRPWTLTVIDRSFLIQKELQIMDLRLYLGDIYLLDYKKGLLRMDITVDQQIVITGIYEAEGFTRFGVYSNNMDDQFYIALANKHSVYQIDWSQPSKPVLLTKYSILPDSNVQQVWINEVYLVVQSYSDVKTATGVVEYNYTWIFNRGDRTYSKAYKVLNHANHKAYVSLNRQSSYLMVFDEDTITNYEINRPILEIVGQTADQSFNIINNFTVIANSVDPLTNTSATCKFVLNFTTVTENNKTMWASGFHPYVDYAVNYPGRLQIPIYEYAVGPNISYSIFPNSQSVIPPKSYILQQNMSNLHWATSPGMIATRFMKTQQFTRLSNDTLIIYLQDLRNKTYVSWCTTDLQDINIYCNETYTQDTNGAITNWATTLFFNFNTLNYSHYSAYTTGVSNSTIVVTDLNKKQKINTIRYGGGYQGYVTSIEITENYLLVVQQYIKTILVYDLNYCTQDDCSTPIYKIDYLMMFKLGIQYFNPIQVYTSKFHPQVVFIQTSNSIIILDIDNAGKPVLLGIIQSEATKTNNFKVGLNFNYLIVVSPPNLIEQYNLQELYQRKIYKTKNYPLYQYTIPQKFDLDVSDQGDTIYVTVLSPTGSKNVFVYRGGYPNVGSLYDTIDLNAYQDLLIDVTGAFEDFVTIVSGSTIRIFKQYELPLAIVEDNLEDSQFWIQYSNTDQFSKLSYINLKVINWPTEIKVNPFYNDVMNTKDILYSGKNRVSEFNDENWYKGNVLKLQADCLDCHDKVTVKNHIQYQRDIVGSFGMQDYQWGFDGGSIQETNHLFHMKHNGSIDQIVNLPQGQMGQVCFRVAVPDFGSYHISACLAENQVNLYVTSFVSSKGFSWGPWSSNAKHCTRIEVVNQLVMLVDVDPRPQLRQRAGGVFIYNINVQQDSEDYFNQIEYIDSDDFGGVVGWDDSQTAFIGNAEMVYVYWTDSYRLLITETKNGIFLVDFYWPDGASEIIIKKIDFIDLNKLLAKNNYRVPYDSTYGAVSVMRNNYNSTTGTLEQSILVTSSRFQTFQIDLITDKAGNVLSVTLVRVYLRYSFYEIQNHIKFFDQYFVISQVIPQEFAWAQWYSRQLVTVYHTAGAFNGTIEERGFLGAYTLQQRVPYNYDFNWTFFHMPDGTTQTRQGLVLVDRVSKTIKQLSVYKNISVYTTDQLDSQIIYLDLINDFSVEKIRIYMHGKGIFAQWKIVLITISCIIFLGIVGVIGYIFVRKRMGGDSQDIQPDSFSNKESLITQSNRQSIQSAQQ